MALLRTLIGILAVIALTVAPACALSRAPLAHDVGAHHNGAAMPAHCGGGDNESGKTDAATALCAFFCGFFLIPTHASPPAIFEASHFTFISDSIRSAALKPPAPPPRG